VAGEENGACVEETVEEGDGGDVEAVWAERDGGGVALAQGPQAAAPLGGGVSLLHRWS
jgi:hypothetical protein